jgi:hypothetical protein
MDESAGPAAMLVPVHRLTPYLKVRIRVDDRSLTIRDTMTLFGFIPLRKRRIEIPLAEYASYRFRTVARLDCLAALAALIAAIVVLSPPAAIMALLAAAALAEFLLFVPNKAFVVVRADGRGWTIRFCRDYAFDASLAFLDAEQRRDAQGELRRKGQAA